MPLPPLPDGFVLDTNMPEPPDGFVLDAGPSSAKLPDGFVLDSDLGKSGPDNVPYYRQAAAATFGRDDTPRQKLAKIEKFQGLAGGKQAAPTLGTYDTTPAIEGRGSVGKGLAASAYGGYANTLIGAAGLVAPEWANERMQGVKAAMPYDDTFLNTAAAGIGSAVPFAASFLLPGGPAVSMGAATGLGAATGAGSERADIAQLRSEGQQISGGQELLASTLAGARGGVEGFLQNRIAATIAPAGGAMLARMGTGGLARTAAYTAPVLGGMALGGGVEAGSQFAGNVSSKAIYDFSRPLSRGVGDAFIGGLAGEAVFAPKTISETRNRIVGDRISTEIKAPAAVASAPRGQAGFAARFVADAVGKKVVWYNSPSNVNAFYDEGTIYANADRPGEAIPAIMAHEAIAHASKDPAIRAELADIRQRFPGMHQQAMERYAQMLESSGFADKASRLRDNPELMAEEGDALLIEEAVTGDPALAQRWATQYPGVFGRMARSFTETMDRLAGGSKAKARYASQQRSIMRDILPNIEGAGKKIVSDNINAEEAMLDRIEPQFQESAEGDLAARRQDEAERRIQALDGEQAVQQAVQPAPSSDPDQQAVNERVARMAEAELDRKRRERQEAMARAEAEELANREREAAEDAQIGEEAANRPNRPTAKREISKAAIRRNLVDRFNEENEGGLLSFSDDRELAKYHNPFTFRRDPRTRSGLPAEVETFLQGRGDLRAKKFFTVTDSPTGGNGADAMGELGDRYFQIIDKMTEGKDRAALEYARKHADPNMQVAAAVHDLVPEGGVDRPLEMVRPGKLPIDSEYTVFGKRVEIIEDADGNRILRGEGIPEVPADAVDEMPMDKGSLKAGQEKQPWQMGRNERAEFDRRRAAKRAEQGQYAPPELLEGDLADESRLRNQPAPDDIVPFSIRGEDNPDLFGRPTFSRATGRSQGSLFHETTEQEPARKPETAAEAKARRHWERQDVVKGTAPLFEQAKPLQDVQQRNAAQEQVQQDQSNLFRPTGEKPVEQAAKHGGSLSQEDAAVEEVRQMNESEFVSMKATRDAVSRAYFDKEGIQKASSRTTPVDAYPFKLGDWRLDESKGIYGREIERLELLNPDQLELPEGDYTTGYNAEGRGDDARRYVEWLKQGKMPPPIFVVQTDGGNFRVSDGHRRAAAAKMAGMAVPAWVSYRMDTGKKDSNGKPIYMSMTYEGAKHGAAKAYEQYTADQMRFRQQIAFDRGEGAPPAPKPSAEGFSIEEMSTTGLRKTAKKYGIDPKLSRQQLLDELRKVEQSRGEPLGDEDVVRFSIAGERSIQNLPDEEYQTAKYNLRAATAMTADGVDREKVRLATGWFKGGDGKWRYEIDDSGMRLRNPSLSRGLMSSEDSMTPLDELVDHPALFEAYPQLRDLRVRAMDVDPTEPTQGQYLYGDRSLSAIAPDEATLRRTVMHEIQHAIQEIEGFARGASPSEFTGGKGLPTPMTTQARKMIESGQVDPAKAASLRKKIDEAEALNAYKNQLGEREARDVESRIDMTAEQRKTTPPDYGDGAQVRLSIRGEEGNSDEGLPVRGDGRRNGNQVPVADRRGLPGVRRDDGAAGRQVQGAKFSIRADESPVLIDNAADMRKAFYAGPGNPRIHMLRAVLYDDGRIAVADSMRFTHSDINKAHQGKSKVVAHIFVGNLDGSLEWMPGETESGEVRDDVVEAHPAIKAMGIRKLETGAGAKFSIRGGNEDRIPSVSEDTGQGRTSPTNAPQRPRRRKKTDGDPATMTPREFYSAGFYIHNDLRSGNDSAATREAILRDGFWRGMNVNAVPASVARPDETSPVARKYAPRPGADTYLVPPEGIEQGPNGAKVKQGWKPRPDQIIRIKEGETLHDAIVRQARDRQSSAPADPGAKFSIRPADAAGIPDAKADDPKVLAAAAKAWREKGTESPWFRRWFSGSRVVDGEGKPLVVYHGTQEGFSEFKDEKIGTGSGNTGIFGVGHYFTESSRSADNYAQRVQDRGSVVPAYLQLKKPFRIDESKTLAEFRETLASMKGVTPDDIAKIEATRRDIGQGDSTFSMRVNTHDSVIGNLGNERFTELLKQNGYDGVWVNHGKKAMSEIVAFRPEQIKSATGNRGTFDAGSPDVRFSVRGEEAGDDSVKDRANAVIRHYAGKVAGMYNKLPEEVRAKLARQFSQEFGQTPAVSALHEAYKQEIGNAQSAREALIRIVTKPARTDADLVAADRILRGHPVDLNDVTPEVLKAAGIGREEFHRMAQEMSRDMQSLGLPVREEWMDAERHWYPNIWSKYNVRSIMGRLYTVATGGKKLTGSELGHTKARTTDRFTVIDAKSGKLMPGGIFATRAEAEAFVAQSGGEKPYFIKYRFRDSDGKMKDALETFSTIHEARRAINSHMEDGLIRPDDEIKIRDFGKKPELRIMEPMTIEQQRAHGLVEDVETNFRSGVRSAQSLVAKVRFFDGLHKAIVGTDLFRSLDDLEANPSNEYLRVKDLGLKIPDNIDNANIRALMDGAVRKDLADDLAGMFGERNGLFWKLSEFGKELDRISGFRKWVTYRNPFRYIKQFPENEMMMYVADAKAFADVKARASASAEFIKWAKSKETDSPILREFVDSGLLETDFLHGPEIAEAMHLLNRKDGDPSTRHDLAFKGIAAIADRIVGKGNAEAVDNFAKTVYGLQDAMYKYQLYAAYRSRGLDAATAAENVRSYTFDWERAPRLVKNLQFIPFAPSVMWQFSRIFGNKMKADPAGFTMKLGLTIGGLAMLRAGLMSAFGIEDEERDKMAWYEMPLPMTDSNGRQMTMDSRWMVPFQDVSRFVPGDAREFRALWRSALPMTAQPVATLATQQTRFGRPIIYDNEEGKAGSVITEAMFDAAPGMLGQYWRAQYRNATRDDKYGQDWWVTAFSRPAAGISAQKTAVSEDEAYKDAVAPVRREKNPERPEFARWAAAIDREENPGLKLEMQKEFVGSIKNGTLPARWKAENELATLSRRATAYAKARQSLQERGADRGKAKDAMKANRLSASETARLERLRAIDRQVSAIEERVKKGTIGAEAGRRLIDRLLRTA